MNEATILREGADRALDVLTSCDKVRSPFFPNSLEDAYEAEVIKAEASLKKLISKS